MSEFDLFLLGCLNFAALIALLIWGLRRTARQFFYARRATLRKQMVVAAQALREAKGRAAKSRSLFAHLAEDVAYRKDGIAAAAAQRCDQIAEEAKRRAGRILDAAERQMKEEQARALADVRRQMILCAFRRVRDALKGKLDRGSQKKILERGCAELTALFSERRRQDLSIG